MNCASCGRANRPNARFCNGCGQSLTPRCARCGSENAADAQFCDACGAALAVAGAPEASARKIVTIVFADLIGSVGLHERLDAENARRFTARYHEAMSAAVEAHGGTVVQLLGDGVLTAFGVPRVSEDDAIRGVRAAVAMQSAFRELLREQGAAVGTVGLRVAVNTGEVVVSSDQTSVIGDPTNVAARLQQEARDGDVLLGEATQILVDGQVTLAPLGSFAIRGRVEPVSAFRVVSLDPPAGAQGTAFVGREEELRRLRASYDAAVAKPSARLAVLLGSPGLGKSRLLAEFTRRLSDRATVLAARCDSARGHSFAPLAAALRVLLELEDSSAPEHVRAAIDRVVSGSDAERVRIATGIAALLAAAPLSSEEAFFVVRRLLAALAATRPVVVAIDDVQWAEPLLLDLAEHLVQWSAGVPLLVLLGARPELHETRAALTAVGGPAAEVVTLGGLDASSATRLAANAIGADELPAALVGRVLAVSEGNPLFVGELVRMLVHDGALKREGDRWTTGVELARLEMPPTIHALLAARIERLAAEDRAILERASVVGRRFSRTAVAHLLQRDPAELEARLESLRRSEWVEPDGGYFLGEPALRFHHALIRDAAYRRLLRRTRAELHERLADWIAERAGDAPEHDELLGRHLEQAHAHMKGLGPLDAHGSSLGGRAARHLGKAGRRALARDDLRPASDLLGRALVCLENDDPARADLALDWCEALLSAGEVAPAARALAELGRFTAGSERLRAWHACFAGELAVLTDPQALHATAEAVSAAAAALAAVGDVAGEAKAHSVHATALARLGQIGESEAALDRALAAARRARDRRRANGVLAGAPIAALFGPSPVARASGRCLDVVRVLRITQGAPAVEAVALRCQAVLEALRGRTDAARRMIASARRTVEELGVTQQLLEVEFFAGYIELLEGDREAAARCLSVAYEGLRKHGLGIDAARAAALLARTRLAQGDAIGAEVLTQESEALAGDDLNASIAWRGVRAEALARRGEHAAAVELARAAVEIAAPTDALLHHANARVALAVALRAAGRHTEAEAEQARAIELWEAKGATLLVERARDRATQPARAPEVAPRAVERRVRPNAATANAARFQAAFAARDREGLLDLIGDSWVGVHHSTGAVYDWARNFVGLEAALGATSPEMIHDPLASLGDSLAICRRATSIAEMTEAESFDFGPIEREDLSLIEVDGNGRSTRVEVFDPRRVGDAVARLYERHAERLPEGPQRDRAASIARSVAALLGPADVARWAEAFAPEVEFADMRTVGPGVVRGVDAVLQSIRALFALSDDFAVSIDDVLASRDDALVVAWRNQGVQHDGGGAFERDLCQLFVFGPDGRLAQWQQFEAGREAEALASFDAALEPIPTRARARPNAATLHAERFDRIMAERNAVALPSVYSEGLEVVHHPTGAVYGHSAAVARLRATLDGASDLSFGHEPLGTLGESLGLFRAGVETDLRVVIEADAEGRALRVEVFASDQFSEAVARLYTRYAELELDEPARTRAATTARAIAAMLGPVDLERYADAFASEVEMFDRRTLGFGRVRGATAVMRGFGAMDDLVALSTRIAEVLALSAEALLVRWVAEGSDRSGGGAIERDFLLLWRFGPDGRVSRAEHFDLGREADALARFDELASVSAVPNAVARAMAEFERAWRARDWNGVLATYAPSHEMDDRRPLFRMQVTSQEFLANERMLFEQNASRWQSELVATRGERLALLRVGFTAQAEGSGPMSVEMLDLIEVDAAGRRVALVVFDPEDGDAALAELEARHTLQSRPRAAPNAAQRATGRMAELMRKRDWAAFRALASGDFRFEDRRKHSQLTGDVEMYIRNLEVVTTWPDRKVERTPLAAPRDDVSLDRIRYTGGADGAEYDGEFLRLCEIDAEGRLRAVIHFDPDDRRAASRELAERGPELGRALRDRDLPRIRELLPEDFSFHDHRRTGPGRLLSADYISWLGSLFESSPDALIEIERQVAREAHGIVSIGHTWGTLAGGGEFESRFVQLNLTSEDGRPRVWELFELEDLDVALARLAELRPPEAAVAANVATRTNERFMAGFEARDWAEVERMVSPALVFEDRRRHVQIRAGRELYLTNVRLLSDVARTRRSLLATAGDRIALYRTLHTSLDPREDFEVETVTLVQIDAEARLAAVLVFDPDAESAARAELAARGDPLRIPPNAASRALDRLQALISAGDWDALRELCAPAAMEDRRPHVQLRGDGETLIANLRLIEGRADFSRRLVATAGERLALERLLFSGPPSYFEIETLQLTEVDGDGRISAAITFGLDQRAAAYDELSARLAHGEAADCWPPAILELIRCLRDRDLGRLAKVLPEHVVFHDHRRTGIGRIEGAAEYIASVAALFEQVQHFDSETLYWVGIEPHASLAVARTAGTLVIGGGEFESIFLRLVHHDAGGIRAIELFELDDLPRAQARFAKLRPDLLRVPPNSASRFDVEPSPPRELLATAGDRLALERVGGSLRVTELDADGKLAAVARLDPNDRRGASLELLERFVRSGAPEPAARALTMYRALYAGDVKRLRSDLPGDFFFRDHRLTGPGLLEGDAYVAWQTGLVELSSDAVVEPLHFLAVEPHGCLAVAHTFGTHPQGGAFENAFVLLWGPVGVELFELADVARARKRFAELRQERPAVRPNAASRARERWFELFQARDWPAMEAQVPLDFVYDDRQRHSQVRGGRELLFASQRYSTRSRVKKTLLATAGERLALERNVFSAVDGEDAFEIETLALVEADARGRIATLVIFDADAEDAARAELAERAARLARPS